MRLPKVASFFVFKNKLLKESNFIFTFFWQNWTNHYLLLLTWGAENIFVWQCLSPDIVSRLWQYNCTSMQFTTTRICMCDQNDFALVCLCVFCPGLWVLGQSGSACRHPSQERGSTLSVQRWWEGTHTQTSHTICQLKCVLVKTIFSAFVLKSVGSRSCFFA